MTTRHHFLAFLFLFVNVCLFPTAAQESDTVVVHTPEDYLSGTLPVLYINTRGGEEITSKENYLEATCYLDAMGIEGVTSLGSEEEQVELLIKGRGNSSWVRPKKPVRLKFNNKVSLLGMDKNRHFVLATEWPDGYGRINWEMGFFVSRLMGLSWTCEHHPIEVVINGDYRGLYFLTEKIRVGKDCVNIEEQDDEDTDPERITGGWLCEIDNYLDSKPQVILRDRTSKKYIVTTVHSPEVLSDEQNQYITNFVKATDQAIYCPDKMSTDWEQFIDLDMLARYYLVCEIIYQIEGFSGSCYWSKDRGEDTKIIFGPIWDFDTSMASWSVEKFFYEEQEGDAISYRNHWIMELVKYPRFQRHVRELWQQWRTNAVEQVHPHCAEWIERVRLAHLQDVKRWHEHLSFYTNIDSRSSQYLEHFDRRQQWLDEQWAKPIPVIGDADGNQRIDTADVATMRRLLLGLPIDTLARETANTYDDEIIDISDFVGVLRQVYLQQHPDAHLRYCKAVPFGVNDKAIDNKMKLIPRIDKDTVTIISTMEQQVQLEIAGMGNVTAFDFELRSPTVDVSNISLGGTLAGHRLEVIEVSDSVTRVLAYSDSLTATDATSGQAVITLTLAFKGNSDLDFAKTDLQISSIHVAEDDMTPHYLADAQIPVSWMRIPMDGDVNCNGIIDIDDLNIIVNLINRRCDISLYPYADIDKSGFVDIDDLNELINVLINNNPFVEYNIDDVSFKMVKVKGGTFTMGATAEQADKASSVEKPAHLVRLDAFLIGQTEVTQALWKTVMGTNPSHFNDNPQCPVENVSWDDCQEFIAKLNEITGENFRLPTEAEWEYAARGGRKSQGYRYAGADHSNNVAWQINNSAQSTHPVAQKQPNELQIYDMSGNVWEWCQDWYANYEETDGEVLVNPSGPEEGSRRVCRGGSWKNENTCCRVSNRSKGEQYGKANCFGLRLAK